MLGGLDNVLGGFTTRAADILCVLKIQPLGAATGGVMGNCLCPKKAQHKHPQKPVLELDIKYPFLPHSPPFFPLQIHEDSSSDGADIDRSPTGRDTSLTGC